MKKSRKHIKNKDTYYSTYCTKYIHLPSDIIRQIINDSYYQKSIREIEGGPVNINHLENVFTDENYYLAMKTVPLLERKVLYLYYVENCRLNEICKRLKLEKNQVINLKSKGIAHFKNNLALLYKVNHFRKGGKNDTN